MRIRPLNNRLVVTKMKVPDTTVSGIIIAGVEPDETYQAEIVEVGPNVVGGYKAGDTILYKKFYGTEVKVGDMECLILEDRDILLSVE